MGEAPLPCQDCEKFDKALAQFVEHAASEGRQPVKTSGAARTRDFDIAALRAWAAKKGIEVRARGRIPATIVDEFKASAKK